MHSCDACVFNSSRTFDGMTQIVLFGQTVFKHFLFSREQVSGGFIQSYLLHHKCVSRGHRVPVLPFAAAVLFYYLYKRTAEYMGDPRLYEDSVWLRDAFARARQ